MSESWRSPFLLRCSAFARCFELRSIMQHKKTFSTPFLKMIHYGIMIINAIFCDLSIMSLSIIQLAPPNKVFNKVVISITLLVLQCY